MKKCSIIFSIFPRKITFFHFLHLSPKRSSSQAEFVPLHVQNDSVGHTENLANMMWYTSTRNMPRLTAEGRERVIRMVQMRSTYNAVANAFECYCATVIRLIQLSRETGVSVHRPRNGRPRIVTIAEYRYLRHWGRRVTFLVRKYIPHSFFIRTTCFSFYIINVFSKL